MGQYLIVVPLHPDFGVLCIRPSGGIQINPRLRDNGFVKRKPVFYPVSKCLKGALCILYVAFHHVFGVPAFVLQKQFRRQLIMLQADHRFNAGPDQRIDHLIVIGQRIRIHLCGLIIRNKPGPVDGRAVRVETTFLHQADILFVPVVIIRCHGRSIPLIPALPRLLIP